MTVKFGQDLQVRKLLYQEVRFLSEGWYRIFWERRSCTKKCEKTLRMVRLCPAREDPDQIEHLCNHSPCHAAWAAGGIHGLPVNSPVRASRAGMSFFRVVDRYLLTWANRSAPAWLLKQELIFR